MDRIHSNPRVEWFDPPLATSFRRAARSAALFSGAATTGGVGRELEVRRGFSHLNRAHASRSLGMLISPSCLPLSLQLWLWRFV